MSAAAMNGTAPGGPWSNGPGSNGPGSNGPASNSTGSADAPETRSRRLLVLFERPVEIDRTDTSNPFAAMPWEDLEALFSACLHDVIAEAGRVPDLDVLVYKSVRSAGEPDPDPGRSSALGQQRLRISRHQDGEEGPRLRNIVEGAFTSGYERVLVALENHPLMKAELFNRALERLSSEDECIIVTPTGDGRCSMIGLRSDCPPGVIPAGSAWPAPDLLGALCEADAALIETGPHEILDSAASLERLREELVSPDRRAHRAGASRATAVLRGLGKKYNLKRSAR